MLDLEVSPACSWKVPLDYSKERESEWDPSEVGAGFPSQLEFEAHVQTSETHIFKDFFFHALLLYTD